MTGLPVTTILEIALGLLVAGAALLSPRAIRRRR
jgi:hypothetical protein